MDGIVLVANSERWIIAQAIRPISVAEAMFAEFGKFKTLRYCKMARGNRDVGTG
jgi:hypothetical protein